MSDEQLASHPRFKSLFNKFWEEKMQEISNKGEKNLRNNKSGFIKSPSDTTIYRPALTRVNQTVETSTPGVALDNCMGNDGRNDSCCQSVEVNDLVSNFIDSMHMQQKQSELDLQEKER